MIETFAVGNRMGIGFVVKIEVMFRMIRSAFLCCLLLTQMTMACGGAEVPLSKGGYGVEIWSSVNGGIPSRANKLVSFSDIVELYAVVKHDGKYYSDSGAAIEEKLTDSLSNLKKKVGFEWFKVETSRERYSTKAGFDQYLRQSNLPKKVAKKIFERLKMDQLIYEANSFGDPQSHTLIDQKSVTNGSLKWRGEYVGTMRYKVVARIDGITVSSPGESHLNEKSFLKKKMVHRISKKADTGNEILDMGFAHGNLPYYYGSNTPRLGWYGSDCAKFVSVVYQKTVRPNFAYQSTYKLAQKRPRSILSGMNNDGVYTHKGKPIRYGKEVKVGDILVMTPSPHHAGLIGEDRNQNGLLDPDDYVLHTLKKAPTYVAIKDAHFGPPNKNLKVLRVVP